jgi:hypothetical protein
MFLQMHGQDTFIIFVDAYDVIFVRPPNAFIQSFADIVGESGHAGDIVISAEKNCWPFNHPHLQDCPELGMGFEITKSGRRRAKANTVCATYPKAKTAYHFLNSGAFVGRRHSLIHLFKSFVPLKDVIPKRCILTEQGLLQHAYLSSLAGGGYLVYPWLRQVHALSRGEPKARLLLDTNTRLFHNLGEGGLSDLVIAPWQFHQIHNNGTGSEPFLLHFNGGKKPYFDIGIPLAKAITDISGLSKLVFRCEERELKFSDICGEHLNRAFKEHPHKAEESWDNARRAAEHPARRV